LSEILSLTTTTFIYRQLSRTTRVSQYQNDFILDSIGAKADGGGEVTPGVIRRAKLQLNHHHSK